MTNNKRRIIADHKRWSNGKLPFRELSFVSTREEWTRQLLAVVRDGLPIDDCSEEAKIGRSVGDLNLIFNTDFLSWSNYHPLTYLHLCSLVYVSPIDFVLIAESFVDN